MRLPRALLTLGVTLLAGSPAEAQGNSLGQRAAVRIHSAQQFISYRGVRLFYSYFAKKVRYQVESVAVRQDSKGGRDIRLKLDQVLYHSSEFPGMAVAKTLFSRRQASHLKYRDFRIQDLGQAFKNYSFTVKGNEKVAGRDCDVCVVTPRVPDRRPWMLWVDVQSGLVLRADEYSIDYQLLSLMIFETQGLQIGPTTQFGDIKDWYVPSAKTSTFKTITDAEISYGRRSLLPTYLPSGYTLQEITTKDLGKKGHRYLTLTYTDGVDTLLVVNGLVTAQSSASTGHGESEETPIINRYTSGSLVQLWTETKGTMVMIMGRMGSEQIPLTFESVFLAQ